VGRRAKARFFPARMKGILCFCRCRKERSLGLVFLAEAFFLFLIKDMVCVKLVNSH